MKISYRLSKVVLRSSFILAILALLSLIAGEIVVRRMGMTDFPLYNADAQIGYILQPNQKGAFLNKNHWIFNEKCQGAGSWKPNGKTDLLLLGDSIVLGGNPINQPDRLGPQLQTRLPGWQVWPASAGSWSIANEVAYLKRFPDVAADVSEIVWVVNPGDLDGPSVWRTDVTHPRTHPWSSLWYVFYKYVLLPRLGMSPPEPGAIPQNPPILQSTMDLLHQELSDLKKQNPKCSVLFILYPGKDQEYGVGLAFYEKFHTALGKAVASQAPIFDLLKDPHWNATYYRDGIHPNAVGYHELAEIIANKLRH